MLKISCTSLTPHVNIVNPGVTRVYIFHTHNNYVEEQNNINKHTFFRLKIVIFTAVKITGFGFLWLQFLVFSHDFTFITRLSSH